MSEFGEEAVISTPAENGLFRALGILKLITGFHHHIDYELPPESFGDPHLHFFVLAAVTGRVSYTFG